MIRGGLGLSAIRPNRHARGCRFGRQPNFCTMTDLDNRYDRTLLWSLGASLIVHAIVFGSPVRLMGFLPSCREAPSGSRARCRWRWKRRAIKLTPAPVVVETAVVPSAARARADRAERRPRARGPAASRPADGLADGLRGDVELGRGLSARQHRDRPAQAIPTPSARSRPRKSRCAIRPAPNASRACSARSSPTIRRARCGRGSADASPCCSRSTRTARSRRRE